MQALASPSNGTDWILIVIAKCTGCSPFLRMPLASGSGSLPVTDSLLLSVNQLVLHAHGSKLVQTPSLSQMLISWHSYCVAIHLISSGLVSDIQSHQD